MGDTGSVDPKAQLKSNSKTDSNSIGNFIRWCGECSLLFVGYIEFRR